MFTNTVGGKDQGALFSKMAGSIIQLVKTGNPNGGDLPEWLPYSAEKGGTMILDDLCLLQNISIFRYLWGNCNLLPSGKN